jgi:hypothetical protein
VTLVTFRSKKLLAAAKDQDCVLCGSKDGTTVAAHYQGFRSHLLGKGRGIKPVDLAIADLCYTCHSKFDAHEMSTESDPWVKKLDQSELFFYCVIKTLERRVEQGVIQII